MSAPMPAIFFGHGNPMNALARNQYTEGWSALASSFPRPRAVLCVSAHWYIPSIAVTAMPLPRTIHDFGGFPAELFQVQYPAPGSPALADTVAQLLNDYPVTIDDSSWGLDHGTWSVLCHVFPEADIPVIQLSINENEPPDFHYEVGRRLGALRDEGVLVVGSGNLVHNLHSYAWGQHKVQPFDWALRFEERARTLILNRDDRRLIHYEALGQDALLAAPTPDHYLPLLYILGMRRPEDAITFPVEGFDGGSISMLTIQLGNLI